MNVVIAPLGCHSQENDAALENGGGSNAEPKETNVVIEPPRRHSQENDAALENGGVSNEKLTELCVDDLDALLGEFSQNSCEFPEYQLPKSILDFMNGDSVDGTQENVANGGALNLPALEEPAVNEPSTSKADTLNASPKNEGKSVPRSQHVSSDDSDFEQTPKRAPLKLKTKKSVSGNLKSTPTPGASRRREVKTKRAAANDNVQTVQSSTAMSPSVAYQIKPISFAPQSRTEPSMLRALLTGGSSLPGTSNEGAEKTTVTKSRVMKRAPAATPNKIKGKAPLRKKKGTANITVHSTVILNEGVRSNPPVADPIPIQCSDSESEFEFLSQHSDRVLFSKLKKRCRDYERESETVNEEVREVETTLASQEEDLRVTDDAIQANEARASTLLAELNKIQKELQGVEEERQRLEDHRDNIATSIKNTKETLRLKTRDVDRVKEKKRRVKGAFDGLREVLRGDEK